MQKADLDEDTLVVPRQRFVSASSNECRFFAPQDDEGAGFRVGLLRLLRRHELRQAERALGGISFAVPLVSAARNCRPEDEEVQLGIRDSDGSDGID